MFTNSVRIGCDITACHGGSAKISSMFDRPLTLLFPSSPPWLKPTWLQSCLVCLCPVVVTSCQETLASL